MRCATLVIFILVLLGSLTGTVVFEVQREASRTLSIENGLLREQVQMLRELSESKDRAVALTDKTNEVCNRVVTNLLGRLGLDANDGIGTSVVNALTVHSGIGGGDYAASIKEERKADPGSGVGPVAKPQRVRRTKKR